MTESRVVITADANRAVTEFQRFRTQAVGALDHVSKAGGVIGGVLGGIGASLSIAAFTGWIKTAIDATDAASDLSQKTGIAIEDLAGLELAFQKGGMEAGALEGTMSKLSKQIVEGNDAFEKLGLSTKDSTGQLKTNKDMLYELADQFANMEDGVQKTALAQEIFGKSGAAMIPMLNEGSEGLREMDEMARKLGMSLSQEAVDKAGDFNDTLDLLVLGSQGVARGIAAELLPTLSNLTGQFLTTMTSGDRLKNTASFLASGLKLLYTVGVGVVEVFSTLGKTVGAAGAQIVSLLQGNFSQAAEIGRQWQQDVGGSWKATLASIEAAWASTSDGSVDSMVKFTRSSTVVGLSAAELAEQSKKAAKAIEEEAQALAELSGLSGTFSKEWDQLTALYNRKKISVEQLTKAQAGLLAKQPGIKAAAEAELAERKALAAAAEQYADAYDKAAAAKAKALADLEAQREENQLIGLSALELAELNAVRLESRALRAEENAEIAEGLDLTGELAQQYRDEAAALRDLAVAQREGARMRVAAEEATKAAAAQKQLWGDIERTAHDTFISIFDSGKSAFDRLTDTLKNGLYDLLYQMTVKKWILNISGQVSGTSTGSSGADLLGSLFGSGGSGSGGGVMNWIQTGTKMYDAFKGGFSGIGATAGKGLSYLGNAMGNNSIFSFGQGMQGFSAGGVGSGISGQAAGYGQMASGALGALGGIAGGVFGGRAISGGYSAFGGSGNSAVNTGTAVGAAIGSIVPVIGTAFGALVGGLLGGAVNRLFGHKPKEVTESGIAGRIYAQDGASGTEWDKWKQKGGVFRSDKSGISSISMSAEVAKPLTDAFEIIETTVTGFAAKLGVSSDAMIGYYKEFNLSLPKDADARQKVLADFLAATSDEIALKLVPSLAEFKKEGESASATLERLATNYSVVDSAMEAMGATFGAVGVASIGARERLVELFGGVANLAASAAFFSQNYLTEAERIAPVAAALKKELDALGLGYVDTRDEFKSVVLGLDRTTESGAKTFATLMGLQEAFALVYPAIENATGAVAGSAKQAADARAALVEAYDVEREAIEGTMSRMRAFAGSLRTLRDNALLGNLSPLTPQQKYLEARAQYERTLAAARSGDETAQGRYAEAFQAFLEASQLVNASGAQYQRDFAYAQAATEEAIQWAEKQVDVGKASLDALKAQVTGLVDVKRAVLTVTDAINALAGTMGTAGTPVVNASQTGALASLYQSILGRAPDAEGLKYWQQQMSSGASIGDIAKAISLSEEALSMKGLAAPAPLPDFSRMGTVDMAPLVTEIKRLNDEVARLRADAERQTGDAIQANAMAADSSAEKIATATVEATRAAAQTRETRVFPE